MGKKKYNFLHFQNILLNNPLKLYLTDLSYVFAEMSVTVLKFAVEQSVSTLILINTYLKMKDLLQKEFFLQQPCTKVMQLKIWENWCLKAILPRLGLLGRWSYNFHWAVGKCLTLFGRRTNGKAALGDVSPHALFFRVDNAKS